jgi:hypothetical protein
VVQYEAPSVSSTNTGTRIVFDRHASQAQKPESKPPAVFKNAQYVYVEAYAGDALSPHLVPDDREAIYNVEQHLKDWHRYTIVYERDRADLVFLVRKGRIASVTPGVAVDVGGGQPRDRNSPPPDPTRTNNTSVGLGVDAEAGSPDDVLAIYLVNPSGGLDGPIWLHGEKGGLDEPTLPLFQRIKHEVETAYP